MTDLISNALTSLSDVKENLGLDSGDTSKDNFIKRQINAATYIIENFTGRHFTDTTYTNEEYDATNIDQLVLKQRPVIAFTSLDVRDSSSNEDDWETIDTELYFVDYNAGVIDLCFTASGRWNRYRATYRAGYATIPSDIAEAAAILAAYLINNPTGMSGAVKTKEEGQRRIEYYDNSSGTGASDTMLLRQLGIYGTLVSYANNPILSDK